MWSAITAFIVGLFAALEGYLRYENIETKQENKTLLEENNSLRGTIDRYSDRPHTSADINKLFSRAKIAARERDKTE